MEVVTNRNSRSGKLLLLLIALVVLAGVQSGFTQAPNWWKVPIKKVRKAADQRDSEAQYNLGLRYAGGIGVPQDDREAMKWYRKAAEQGHAGAQTILGEIFRKGDSVPQDDRKAAEWYRKAAEQGYASAQYYLADMYSEGDGVPQDDGEAAKWYRKAAEQGVTLSQARLAYMYANGEGVPQDFVKAYAWTNLAAAQRKGMPAEFRKMAVENKDWLRSRMTAEQVADAQKLSAELHKRIESSKSN